MPEAIAQGRRGTTLADPVTSLVQHFLCRIDTSIEYARDLAEAMRVGDEHRATTIQIRAQRALSEAYLAILFLEQRSGSPEPYARRVLECAYQRVGLPSPERHTP